MSLCYTFVLHSCVTVGICVLGTKKRLEKQGVIHKMVEIRGFEPLTYALRTRRSTN